MSYINRVQALRQQMKEKNIGAVLLTSDVNRNYMTGFTGDESFTIITDNKALFITDSRYMEQAKQQVEGYEILEYKIDIVAFIADIINVEKIERLAFEDTYITYDNYKKYKENFKCELVPLEGIIENFRILKDELEIEKIRKAASIADKAFEHIQSFIKPGVSERDISIELEFFMKKQGASALSFPSIVASGVRSALPHGAATDKLLKEGEFLTLDFGCVYEEYCSDMTRTVVVGKPNDKMLDIYNTVLKAQEAALCAIKPEVSCFDVDKIARDIIKECGYGEYFGHGLGHGVGRIVHESPRLSPKSKEILKAGMIVTDEPGIYLPDFGGVRIEDLVLVTKDGYEVLSKSPKELICIE